MQMCRAVIAVLKPVATADAQSSATVLQPAAKSEQYRSLEFGHHLAVLRPSDDRVLLALVLQRLRGETQRAGMGHQMQ